MEIAPFRAVRYAASLFDDLDSLISLPYDQFGDEGREERYARHDYNVVRLITPHEGDQGTHEAARRTFARWLDQEVLARDEQPSIYPYRQRFLPPGGGTEIERWSFICRLRLSRFDDGPVRPHEQTYPDTVSERSGLRAKVGADLGLILATFDDPDRSIDEMVRDAGTEEPLFEATDEAGTRNALWRWDGPRAAALCEAGRSAGVILADGHHRYTAALQHWQSVGGAGDDSRGWVMAALASEASSGVRILPIHRLTEREPDDELLARCADIGLSRSGLAAAADADSIVAAAQEALAEHRDKHAIVVVRRDDGALRADLLAAEADGLESAPWPTAVPATWRRLDVTVLQTLILDPWLGAELEHQTEDHGAVDYDNDTERAVAQVRSGRHGAAFLLNPLTVDDVRDTVFQGDVLPAKSTNYYPKVVAGLTFHVFADQDPVG